MTRTELASLIRKVLDRQAAAQTKEEWDASRSAMIGIIDSVRAAKVIATTGLPAFAGYEAQQALGPSGVLHITLALLEAEEIG